MPTQHPVGGIRSSVEPFFKIPAATPAQKPQQPYFFHAGRALARLTVAVAAAAILLVTALQAQGAEYWTVPSGDWSVATNWNGGAAPSTLDNAFIINGGTVAVTLPNEFCQNLYLGDPNSAASGTLQILNGYLTAINSEYVGNNGSGTLFQSGGVNNLLGNDYSSNGNGGSLYLGFNAGSSGTYNLSGGSLNAYYEYVGNFGVGTFNQSGGTNTAGNIFALGQGTGSSGTYNLSGLGSLSAYNEYLGYFGAGTFNQSGGTNTPGSLNLGYYPGSGGIYNLSGGAIAAGNEFLGYFGTGTFNQTGGTNTSSSLNLGYYPGSSGIYSLSGSAATLSANTEYVGGYGTGTFLHSGGVNNLNGGSLYLGNIPGYAGTYALSGSGLLSNASEYVGSIGPGTFNQTGGTNNLGGGSLYVGYTAGVSGSYSLSGGSLAAATESVGYSGPGTFNQTGGTNNLASGSLYLGQNAGSNGIYALSGSASVLTALAEYVGSSGSGTFNQTGGSNAATFLSVAPSGIYNLSNGTLEISSGIALQGTFNGAGTGVLSVAASSMVDMTTGTWLNTGSMSVSIGADTLLLVPSTSATFGHFTDLGIVHTVGTPLTVSSTQGFSGAGNLADHVYCQGAITAIAGTSINLNGGLTISASGSVNLGNGSVIVNDALSGITSAAGSLTAFNVYVGSAGTGTFNQSGGASNLGDVSNGTGGVCVGNNASDVGTYILSGGSLSAIAESVGNSGAGTFNQSGGTNSVVLSNLTNSGGSLSVGNNAGSNGSYILSNSGVLSVAGAEIIGYSGTGALSQFGGTNNVGNSGLIVGYNANSSGSYALGGSGVLTAFGTEYVGNYGTGAFNQSGGTNSINSGYGYLYVGNYLGASGSYSLSGSGLLSAYTLTVGNSGAGAFSQSGGINSTSFLYLGGSAGGSGSYTLSNSGLLAISGEEYVGSSGSGSFIQSGGTNSIIGGILSVGDGPGSNGSYNLSGSGALLTVSSLTVGNSGSGTFLQSGGTNNLAGPLTLGVNPGSNGSYNLSGSGSLTASGVYVGSSGAGTFIQSGGTNNVNILLSVGDGPGSSGNYNLSGSGAMLFAPALTVGNSGSGTFLQSGGTNSLAGPLVLGSNAGSSGSYNLSGGSLAVPLIETVGNFGGGAFVQSGGANFIGGGSAGTLTIGGNPGGSGSYALSGSGVLSASAEYLGTSGSGAFTQTGGSNATNYLAVGSLGSYTLGGGTLQITGSGALISNQSVFGSGGAGLLTAANSIVDLSGGLQNTGSMTVTMGPNSLLLLPAGDTLANSFSAGSSSAGLVHAVGTTLTVSATQGFAGLGSITDLVSCQGTISAAPGGWINLYGGAAIAGSGNVTLGNGVLTANGTASGISAAGSLSALNGYVGYSGSGIFNQTGGTNSLGNFASGAASGGLYLGNNATDAGTYNLSGTASLLTAYYETVGNSGSGTFNQPLTGTNLVQSDSSGNGGLLSLGNNPGSSGIYTLGGSAALTVAGSVNVGVSGQGSFVQSGGTNTIGTGSSGALTLGGNLGSSGSYALSGSGTITAYNEYVGSSGAGTFLHSGGTNTVANALSVGDGPGSSGSYTLSGSGAVLTTSALTVGNFGTGTFNQPNGTNNSAAVTLGSNPGSSGSYNLSGSGALLSVSTLTVGGSGTGTFTQSAGTNTVASALAFGPAGTYNFTGGVLQVTGSQAAGGAFNFGGGTLLASGAFSSAQAMTLTGSGGNAIIDNGGGIVTLSGALSGPGGLIATDVGTLILLGSNTYAGGTTITGGCTLQIDSGGATGSLAGNITNNSVLVFSRSDNVTFNGSISGSGSLVQAGPGILTLASSNSFSGGTSITGGSLTLNNANALANGIVTVSSNGGLFFNSNSGAIPTFYIGAISGNGTFNLSDGTRAVALSTGGNGSSTYFAGQINGAGSLIKTGSGLLDLSNNNGYTGSTTISGGTLALDFSQNVSTQNIISSSSSLALSGGTLAVLGSSINGNLQTLNGVTLNPGSSAIVLVGGPTPTLQLTMGSISRSVGGTVVFTLPNGNQGNLSGTQNGITTTNPNSTSGTNAILGAYATVIGTGGVTYWATASGTASGNYINAFTSYPSTYNGGVLNTFSSSASVNCQAGGAQATLSSKTFNTVVLNNSWNSLPLSSTATLTLAGGGLLIDTAGTISGGTLEGSSGASGELIVVTAANLTLGSIIANNSGSTALTKTGSGTLFLTGSNTYSGPTTIDTGTLQVSMGSLNSVGALGPGPVVDDAALVYSVTGAATCSGISGIGSLTQMGSASILTLTGSNTYSGGTTVSTGTLQVGNGTSGEFLGSPTISLGNSGVALIFNHADALTYGGVISGSGNVTHSGTGSLTLLGNNSYTGNLTQTNSGSLTLLGSNTYSGGTTISAGTLQVGNGTSGEFLGSPTISLGNSGVALIFNHADALNYSGVISGSGSLTQAGPGILTLPGSNTYTGSTTVSGGTLQFSGPNLLGPGVVTNNGTLIYSGASTLGTGPVTDNGALVYNLSASPTFAGLISGGGSLTQMGPGALTLLASNTYSGGTTISAGTLQLSGSSAMGSGPVVDNGTLLYNLSTSPTYVGGISGSGSVTQGTGLLTLLGSNTYTGNTTISTGTLQIGNGTSGEFLASPSVVLSGNAGLIFNHADALTYKGVISGAGNVTQAGTGSLTLLGNNSFSGNLTQTNPSLLTLLGANSYTGSTAISGGTLQIGNGAAAGGLSGGGNVLLSNSAVFINDSPSIWVLSSAITGSGSLIQAGTGTLTLGSISDNYNGGTTLNAGELSIAASGDLPTSGALTFNGGILGISSNKVTNINAYNVNWSSFNGGFDVNGIGAQLTVSNAIGGTGSLTKLGGSSLILSASNTYSGGTIINGGILQLAGTGTLGTGPVTDNATLTFNLTGAPTFNGGISGSGNVTQAAAGILTLLGNNTYSGTTTVSAGTLQVGNGTSGEFLGSSVVNVINSATLVFNHADALTFGGLFSGTGNVTQTGASVLTLLGNSYAPAVNTIISAGTLQVGNGGTAGSVPGNVTDNAAMLYNLAGSATFGGVISGSGSLTQSGPGNLTLTGSIGSNVGTLISGGSLQLSGTGTVGAGQVTDNSVLVFNLSGNPTFSGLIAGNGSLIQAGTGILALATNNSFNGGTTISGGSLSLNNANALQSSTLFANTNNNLLFNSNGGALTTFNLGGLAGSGSIALGDGSPLTLSVGGNGASTTFSGALSGTGGLAKAGSGSILTLAGTSNTYSGNTTLAAGELSIAATNNLSPNSLIVFNGGTLQITGTALTSLAGLTISTSAFNGGFDIANAANVFTLNNSLSGTGSLNKLGPGTLLLPVSNTFSGGTTILAGALAVNNANALQNSTVTVNPTNGNDLLFNSNSGAITTFNFGGLAGNGSVSLTDGTWAITLSAGGNGATTAFGGGLYGTGNLTKVGSGVLALLGNNTYSGSTTISSGSLQVGNGTSGEFLGSPTVSISSSAALVFNHSDLLTYGGVISGSGGLIKTGAGILTLLGNNTYSGSTTLAGGELSIAASSSLSASGAVVFNGGVLQITGTGITSMAGYTVNWPTFNGGFDIANAANVFTLNNSLGGAGSLSKLGSGTLLLTGSNNAYGATTISGGTLQVGNGGAGTLGTGLVTDNSALVFSLSGAPLFSNSIAGAGSLTQLSTGLMTLTGSSTYTGGTTISAGTLQVGNGGSGASIAGTSGVLDNASLVFNHGDISTFSPAIGGSGSLTQTGAGALILLGNNTYSGSTTVSTGTLQVGNGASGAFLGSPAVSLGNNAALVFNHADVLNYSGVISGNGGLTQTGAGILVLLGSNTYAGGTTVSGGTLEVGNSTNGEFLGSPSVNLSNSAALVFNHADALTYSGLVGGSGSLIQTGVGILTLLGSNTYNGGTTISAGTLQVSGIGALGTGPVIDNSALVYNPSSSTTISGLISGSGGLTQAGPGVLLLTGSNTYSGGTIVSGGSLQVGNGGANGYLTGSIAMGAGGTLVLDRSDNLTIGNTLTGAGGLVKMGGDTITLGGNLTNLSGSITVGQGQLVLLTSSTATMPYAASGGTLTFQNNTFLMNGSMISAMSGGTVQYNNATITNAFLFGSSLGVNTGLQLLSGTNTNTFNNVTVNAGTVIQQNSPAVFTDVNNYGAISGTGGLTLSGGQNDGGTLMLSGINNVMSWGNDGGAITIPSGGLLNNRNSNLTSYGGGQITINSGGTLNVDSASQGAVLNLNGSLLTNNGKVLGTTYVGYGATVSGSGSFGTLYVSSLTSPGTLAGAIYVAPGSSPQASSVVINNGSVVGNGVFSSPAAILTTAYVSSSGALTLGGSLSGAGQLVATGPDTIILSSSNSYQGGTTVTAGTLQLGTAAALPSNEPATVNGVLDLKVFGANISALTGAGTVNHSGSGSNLLTVASGDFTGTLEDTGGTLALLKTGNGQLILSGTDTYSGGTTVSGGTLYATDAAAVPKGGGLTVGAGGIFDFDPSKAGSSFESVSFTAAPAAGVVTTVATVPEPGSLALLLAGIITAAVAWRKRNVPPYHKSHWWQVTT